MSNNKILKNQYRYPNLAIFFSVIVLTYLLHRTGGLNQMVLGLESLGYLGIFLVGMFFVSTFTVIPATTMLFLMAEKFNILEIALIGGVGSVMGDYIIFRLIKDNLVDELKDVYRRVAGDSVFNMHWVTHTKYFGWLGPVIGAIIIASPLPDELGIGLLGIYKLDNRKFLLLTWFLNTIGLFLLLSAISAVK